MARKTTAICKYCNKEFVVLVSEVARNKGKYCSRSCSSKGNYKPKFRGGSNNPNWKGGISKNNYHYKLLQVERYPERIKARMIVSNAIRSGILMRKKCEICHDSTTDAHHDDYDKPLEVRWLCEKHHRELHNDMKFNKKTELAKV